MNGKATLEARLARLAAAGVAGPEGRPIRATSKHGLPARLLSEIAATVLPRRLGFSTASGAEVTLAAANGRLLRVESATGAPAFLGMDDVLGRAFDPDGAEQDAERIRDLLEGLTNGTDTVFVRAEALPDSFDPERAGLSAPRLAEAWGIELEPAEREEPAIMIDNFLSAAQAAVRAWIMTGPETSESEGSGDDDLVDELRAFAEARRETGDTETLTKIASGEPWAFLALHRSAGAEDMTVIVAVDGLLLYLAVDGERLGDVADAWRVSAAP